MRESQEKAKECCCPYCDQETIEAGSSYCGACGVTIFYCPKCRKPLPRESKECPHCGTRIKS